VFGKRLARHFAGSFDWITGARVAVESYGWDRIAVDGQAHDHAFSRNGSEVRTAVVTADGDDVHVLAGLTDLVVLKTTGSEFWGFPRDRYTTLAETRDRILATAVTARWRYRPGAAPDWDAAYAGARTALLETFASTHSLALQQSLYAMGEAVLERFDEIAEVRLSMPNKHHFLQDLSAYGLDNDVDGGPVVYHADDRPYGLIEGAVVRDDVAPADVAWLGTPGFC
jgi:urate oxidase